MAREMTRAVSTRTSAATPLGVPAKEANSVVNVLAPTPNDTPGPEKVGIFNTPQSLVTFPVATAAITTIWRVLDKVDDSWNDGIRLGAESPWVPLVISLLIGTLIFLTTVSRSGSKIQKLVEAGVAIINSFTIAAAALGISNL
jgi:hypothetical protein